MAEVIGKLRSWRQRFHPNAAFVWRKPTVWDGVEYEAGDLVPDGIRKGKLLTMWNARRIELAMFDQPPGAVPRPDEAAQARSFPEEPPAQAPLPDSGEPASGQVESTQSATSPLPDNVEQRGSWFAVTMPDGSEQRVQGREALDELLSAIGDPNAPSD